MGEKDNLQAADISRVILESIATGVMATDLEGRIISFNKAAEEMYGIPKEEALGGSFFEGLHPQERERLAKTFDYVVKNGRPFYGKEMEVVTRAGKRIMIKPFVTPVRDENGNILGMVMVTEDVTERMNLEEHVRRAEKLAALGQLAVGIAHEIRNPLGSIKGFATIIKRDLAPDDNRQRFVDVIISESERLSRVTQQLLDFARPSDARMAPVNLNDIIERALFLLEMESSIYNVSIVRSLAEDIPDILGAEEELQQLFLNLFQNALQAVAENGIITITTGIHQESGWPEVRVYDNGVGIPPDHLKRIFDPFFTTRENGTGMGLAIVHQIVTAHGGQIQVDSKPGKGSRFIMRFPPRHIMKIKT